MKTLIIVVLSLSLAACNVIRRDADQTETGAADGYAVILQKNDALPITSFNLTLRLGSADDPAGKEGLVNVLARMLKEGGSAGWNQIPPRTRAERDEILYPLAADVELQVGKEQISFRSTVASSGSAAVFEVLAQMLLAPVWDATELDRIKLEVRDALLNSLPREDQEELGKAALDQKIWGAGHPYAHSVLGTVSGVESLTLEDLKEFYAKNFTQSRLTVGIAGEVSDSLEVAARFVFGVLPQGARVKAEIPDQPMRQSSLTIVEGPFESTGVHLGHPIAINRGHSDFAELYFAAAAFGKHRTFVGRLMKVVREVRGLNYGTYAYVEDFPNGSRRLIEPTQAARQRQAFTAWGRPTSLENGCFLLRQMHREIASLAAEGLTLEEFDLVRNHVVGNAPLLAVGIDRRLGYAIDSFFYGIQEGYLTRLQDEVAAATRDQVNDLLSRVIQPESLQIVVVTKDASDFRRQVEGEECRIQYAAGVEKPASVLAEDAEISRHRVGVLSQEIQVLSSADLFL